MHWEGYQKLADGLDTVRKQMILAEICEDLVKIQATLKGLHKYDSVQKTLVRDLKHPERVKRHQGLHQRQYYRQQFSEFLVKEIRDKYSQQMNLYYAGDEAGLDRDMMNGAAIRMRRPAKEYGIQARTLLLKIASLMIHYRVRLTTENFRNPCSVPKRARDPPRGRAPGVLGWLAELGRHEDIRVHLNCLVNMVIE